MANFVDEIIGLHKGLGEFVKEAFKDKTIDQEELRLILLAIVDARSNAGADIDPIESQILMLLQSKGNFNAEARELFEQHFSTDAAFGKILNGSASQLSASDPMFEQVRDSLLGNLQIFNFWSPGTSFQYSSSMYSAMSSLIVDGKIKCFHVQDSGLIHRAQKRTAIYIPGQNSLLLFPFDVSKMPAFICHEATHAVQDYYHLKVRTKFAELDAYIVEQAIGSTYSKSSVFEAAAEFLRDRTAIKGNQSWTDAYNKVVQTYEKQFTDGDIETINNIEANLEEENKQLKDALQKIELQKLQSIALRNAVRTLAAKLKSISGIGKALIKF